MFKKKKREISSNIRYIFMAEQAALSHFLKITIQDPDICLLASIGRAPLVPVQPNRKDILSFFII